jgi:hypothetical protein
MVLRCGGPHLLLTGRLGAPVDGPGFLRRVHVVRRPGGAVEDVVRAQLHDQPTVLGGRTGQHARGDRIDLERLLFVGLRVVDRGPGGAVDHDLVSSDGLPGRERVEQVEVAPVDGCHRDAAAVEDLAQVGAQQPRRPGDQPAHAASRPSHVLVSTGRVATG